MYRVHLRIRLLKYLWNKIGINLICTEILTWHVALPLFCQHLKTCRCREDKTICMHWSLSWSLWGYKTIFLSFRKTLCSKNMQSPMETLEKTSLCKNLCSFHESRDSMRDRGIKRRMFSLLWTCFGKQWLFNDSFFESLINSRGESEITAEKEDAQNRQLPRTGSARILVFLRFFFRSLRKNWRIWDARECLLWFLEQMNMNNTRKKNEVLKEQDKQLWLLRNKRINRGHTTQGK